ncbi:putative glucose-6-phosphate 1-epimerase [Vitis vinifera]|uniref:Putative glucose-6-phosphate 1-epimerase n=1 Tax=Vitis vinifera TaxID=29760 RepID=A0A438D4A3_VITVI|nr:putative glucose-6-phosphate 1-epimerase [Vitis vinifera]
MTGLLTLCWYEEQAIFKPPKAIRGGIPICFPQFGNHGSLEQHGFARNRVWSIDVDPPPFPTNTSSRAFIDLILKPSEEDMKIWPHSYEFRLRVALGPGGDLMLTSRIRNTSTEGKPLTFTFAYHTYFSVSDIRPHSSDASEMTAAESQSTMKLETAKVQPITVLPEGLESLIPNPNLIHLKKAQRHLLEKASTQLIEGRLQSTKTKLCKIPEKTFVTDVQKEDRKCTEKEAFWQQVIGGKYREGGWCFHKVREGYGDKRCSDELLCISFASLFALATSKEAWVRDVWNLSADGGCWEPCFSMRLNNWEDGKFSVEALYKVLELGSQAAFLADVIWNFWVLPTVGFFA